MSKNNIATASLRPIKNNVMVSDLDHGVKQTRSGIILPDDNMKDTGVRDRWAKVHAVGPEVDDLEPGQWVLIKHARWTNGMDFNLDGQDIRLWRVEYPDAVMLVSDSDPRENLDKTL